MKNKSIILFFSFLTFHFQPLTCPDFFVGISFAQYPSQNISLLAKWDTTATVPEPMYGIRYNSVWGWVDPQDNREYAILGATEGTYFIEVTNPSNPVVRDFVAGRRDSCIWREYKTYNNFCYMVSDDAAPNSFQIVDLSYLPDSVYVVHDADTIISRAHTLFVDGNKLYFGIPKSPGYGISVMAVYSLANPAAPQLLRKLDDDFPASDYVHDMFIRNDTVYASSSYSGLFVYKYDSVLNTFSFIGSLTSYPDQGYNHSSALTADGNTLVMCDEVPAGKKVKTVDVSDLTNITVLDTFFSHLGATPHNPYIIGNKWAFIAYYQDGVYIYDISNPSIPVMSGYFDTHPQNGDNNGYPSPAYQGCWGAYVDLPSGILLASDMQNGLFILNPDSALMVNVSLKKDLIFQMSANPVNQFIRMDITVPNASITKFEIAALDGKSLIVAEKNIKSGKNSLSFFIGNMSDGIYLFRISGNDFSFTRKIVKITE